MSAPRFITFEGPDGGGKTTQIQLLAQTLRERGHTVVTGREPGGTAIGDQIRAILHALKNEGMDFRAEFLLYSASRAQVVAEVIRPALAAGKLVILDRFIDSTFAYQGYGRGLDLQTLQLITGFATGGLLPDLTFYLDIDPQMALERRQQAAAQGAEWTRMDAQALDFHHRVRAGYEQLIAAHPDRWVRVDASQALPVIQHEINAHLSHLGL
jgi:dTMP kinase